jgi:hypothetical protein
MPKKSNFLDSPRSPDMRIPPDPWVVRFSRTYGKRYYLNLQTLQTQWKFPEDIELSQAPQLQRKVKTISNTGSLEGMSLQCFWISILDYLHRNGHPYLTLRELRENAGLGADTEHKMFNMDDGQMIFYDAATLIAEIYNLSIQIYSANRYGEFAITDSPRGLIGSGDNLVELAQFGIGHFELIDNVYGSEFIPAVLVKRKLKKITDIDPILRDRYLILSEYQGMLKILRDQSKVNSVVYKKELKTKNKLQRSKELTPDQKEIFLTQHNEFLDELVKEIIATEEKITKLEEEISSLTLIISEFESR